MRHIELNFEVYEQFVDRLTSYLRKSNTEKLSGVLANRFQQLEQQFIDVMLGTQFDNCVGAQLDQKGLLYGVRRDGLSDQEYKNLLLARVLSNASETEIESVIQIMALLVGVDAVRIYNLPPLGVLFWYLTDNPTSQNARNRIRPWIESVVSAGCVRVAHH